MLNFVKRFFLVNYFRFTYKNKLDKDFYSKLLLLQYKLNYKINNPYIFLKALTHRSYLEINNKINKSNERLEFLGDSVLNLIVAKYLWKKFKNENEGFLTKTRSAFVNKNNLYKSAELLKLNELILFNSHYLRGSVDGFKNILADALEALIGAIYIDGGIKQAVKFVNKYVIKTIVRNKEFLVDTNYKGQLLEYCHSKKLPLPYYKVIKEEGPNHDKYFEINVYIGNKMMGEGKGKNKKIAEQEASKNALQKMSIL